MKKRALVTGGCGFIGSNLAKRLVQEGWKVDVVDDLSAGHESFLNGAGVHKVTYCDFAAEEILDDVQMANYDVIFHQAAIPRVSYSVTHPSLTTDTNIGKTVKLMEAARDNVERFVFASSSSVYGGADVLPTPESHPKNPVSPYAWHKSAIEDLAKIFVNLYGLDVVCLRYFNVFGPNQYGDSPYSTAVSAWCHAVQHGTPLRSDGDGEQSRDLCYVDNVVEANLIVASAPQKFAADCFNVACGDRTSNNEILDYFKKRFPAAEVLRAPARPGDVKHTQADISALCALGYEPKVRFWDGLERTINWWGL